MKTFEKILVVIYFLILNNPKGYCQDSATNKPYTSRDKVELTTSQFVATSNLLDAALNSINSLNSLIKKDNYRNKISSFNNPATADIGFSLETEISLAIKPILDKTKNVNTHKFTEIISSLVYNPMKNQMGNKIFSATGVFNSLLTLVGGLAINERKVTRNDVDSFMNRIGKYFAQFEKLKEVNISFDNNIEKFNLKLEELQFDIRELMLDVIIIFHEDLKRSDLRKKTLEELLLKYLDKDQIEKLNAVQNPENRTHYKYPGDAIKSCKEIVYSIQKLFNEYQNIYARNYYEIRTVLLQSKELGNNINLKQLETEIQQFDLLYKESKEADIFNLRLNTLSERLKNLISIEQRN